jgi:uncharacterized protein YndB with AHSA1/START domain
MSLEPIGPYLEPVRKAVTVSRPPAEAFEIFTAGFGRWWPLQRFSIGQEHAVSCAIEPRVGGEIYEVRDDGVRFPWGRVLVWEPPQRFVMTWHPGREPEVAQEVEVRFVAAGSGARVELEHRNWLRVGPDARKLRDEYAGGWESVLGKHFVDACGGGAGRSGQ